ncbi:protein ALP1-like [Aphis craccivora]|uniref:Protein ALP1-like n=1 Tax=Aphis craccivora TaxID=307492 RepID=A0A6G0ZMX6_APHCR|nr:protein ALP1-like [Aphis craccivora]
MDFTNKELAMIALLLDEDEQVAQEPRRYRVHSVWKKHEKKREFQTLYKDLIGDETKFYEYFRMSSKSTLKNRI